MQICSTYYGDPYFCVTSSPIFKYFPSSGPWSLGFDLNFRSILVYSPGYSESISPSSDYLDYDSYDSASYDDDYDKK